MNTMKCLKYTVLVLGGLSIVWAASPGKAVDALPAKAAALRANAGNRFALVPTANPLVLGHPVDGVAQVSLLGNCHFHGESEVHLPSGPGQPITIVSTSPWTLTGSDGVDSLRFDARGTATFDPVNPNFANLTYTATFVGGTGAFEGASGTATFEVTAEFSSPLEGWATWTMKGYVLAPEPGK